jgi:hypothetical protein
MPVEMVAEIMGGCDDSGGGRITRREMVINSVRGVHALGSETGQTLRQRAPCPLEWRIWAFTFRRYLRLAPPLFSFHILYLAYSVLD